MEAIKKVEQNLELVKVFNNDFPPLKLVVGKSGSGKNFLCNENKWNAIPSFTTRPMRDGEKQGREHIFVSMDEYEYIHKQKSKAAYTYFNNNHYWTSVEQIEGIPQTKSPQKLYDAYIIDPKGVFDMIIKKKVLNIKRNFEIVYVHANVFKRFYRMLKRGDGLKKTIDRIIHDRKAFQHFCSIMKNRYKYEVRKIYN